MCVFFVCKGLTDSFPTYPLLLFIAFLTSHYVSSLFTSYCVAFFSSFFTAYSPNSPLVYAFLRLSKYKNSNSTISLFASIDQRRFQLSHLCVNSFFLLYSVLLSRGPFSSYVHIFERRGRGRSVFKSPLSLLICYV